MVHWMQLRCEKCGFTWQEKPHIPKTTKQIIVRCPRCRSTTVVGVEVELQQCCICKLWFLEEDMRKKDGLWYCKKHYRKA